MPKHAEVADLSLFKISWPLFIDIAFHFMTIAANTFMVGLISYQAVAALSVGNQVFDLCITLFNFIGIGSSVVIAQYLGAKRRETAQQVVFIAISINLLVGALACFTIIFAADPIMALMNMPQGLLADGHAYLTIIAICLIPEAVGLCMAAALRAYGYTKDAMYVTLVANVITIIGNTLLLFGYFGLPQMGVAGVAWSTVVGRVAAMIVLVYLLTKKTHIQWSLNALWEWRRDLVNKIFRIGLPAAGENLSWMLQLMVVTAFIALMGEKSLATQSYFFQICLFILLFGLAIGLGTEIIIGHMVGAARFDQAYHQLMRSLKLGCGVTILVVLIVAAGAGRYFLSWVTEDQEILDMATQLFFISLIMEPGRTFNIITISSLRATGDAVFPLIMALISMWGIAVPLAWFLGLHLEWGLVGIWLAFTCDEWTRGLSMLWRWKSRRWQKKALVMEPH